MEDLYEQMEYGRHCVHGVNIGTPGGADLMCGLCEDGMTHLTASTRYLYRYLVRYEDGRPDRVLVDWKQGGRPAPLTALVEGIPSEDGGWFVTEEREEPCNDWHYPPESGERCVEECPECAEAARLGLPEYDYRERSK